MGQAGLSVRKLERRAAKEGASDEKIDQADVSPATVSAESSHQTAMQQHSAAAIYCTRSFDADCCCQQDAANPKEFLIDLVVEGSKDSRAVGQAA